MIIFHTKFVTGSHESSIGEVDIRFYTKQRRIALTNNSSAPCDQVCYLEFTQQKNQIIWNIYNYRTFATYKVRAQIEL